MVLISWPADAVVTGDLITAAQLNGLPVRIANVTLGADAATIEFASVPSHYAHLLVECYLRCDVAAANNLVGLRLNNDSGGNYDHQYLLGSAASASAGESLAATSFQAANCPGSTAGANLFSAATVDIQHYANTANNKSLISQCAEKWGTSSGNLQVLAFSGFWRSNAAISSFYLFPPSGNFVIGSRATLYGLP